MCVHIHMLCGPRLIHRCVTTFLYYLIYCTLLVFLGIIFHMAIAGHVIWDDCFEVVNQCASDRVASGPNCVWRSAPLPSHGAVCNRYLSFLVVERACRVPYVTPFTHSAYA